MRIETAIPDDLVAPHQVIHKAAHPTNYSSADRPVHSGYRPREKAVALVIHTPEEPADDHEVTPWYFAREIPGRVASTDAYADNDGDLWLMVGDRDSPFANGVPASRRIWKGAAGQRPPWAVPGVSLNSITRSIEVEGYARNIDVTLTDPQFAAVVAWCVFWCRRNGIPANRDHIVGHFEIDSGKSDPGTFPLDRLAHVVQQQISIGADPGYGPNQLAAIGYLAAHRIMGRWEFSHRAGSNNVHKVISPANPGPTIDLIGGG